MGEAEPGQLRSDHGGLWVRLKGILILIGFSPGVGVSIGIGNIGFVV